MIFKFLSSLSHPHVCLVIHCSKPGAGNLVRPACRNRQNQWQYSSACQPICENIPIDIL